MFSASASAEEDTYSPIGLRPPWRTELLLCSEQGAEGSIRSQEGGGNRIVRRILGSESKDGDQVKEDEMAGTCSMHVAKKS